MSLNQLQMLISYKRDNGYSNFSNRNTRMWQQHRQTGICVFIRIAKPKPRARYKKHAAFRREKHQIQKLTLRICDNLKIIEFNSIYGEPGASVDNTPLSNRIYIKMNTNAL